MPRMGDYESIQGYADKVLNNVNRLRLLGENVFEKRIVNKLLVSLPEKFEGKISSLEDSKDLGLIYVNKLLNALQAQEQRRALRQDAYVEGAFLARNIEKNLVENIRRNQELIRRIKERKVVIRNKEGHVEKVCKNRGVKIEEKAAVVEQKDQAEDEDTSCTVVDPTSEKLFTVGTRNKCFALNWMKVFFLKLKSDSLSSFIKFKLQVENQTESTIKKLRTDIGTEYTSRKFEEYLSRYGIVHQLKITYSPQQNGISERKNRTLMEMARCLLFEKSLPKFFWTETVNTANYLLNIPKTKALVNKTPYETCEVSKGYRPLDIKTVKFFVSKNVVFDENIRWNWDTNSVENAQGQEIVGDYFTESEDNGDLYENINKILVDKPDKQKVIGVKWMYRTKLNSDGSINKHKVRLVVKGFSPTYGKDFCETFAPVAKHDTIKLMVALATRENWHIWHLDFKSAFLNGTIKEDIYVEQPEGLIEPGSEDKIEQKVATPVAFGSKFSKDDGGAEADETLYRKLVGSLLYLFASGPDIINVKQELQGYSNRDWVGNVDDSKSISGYCFSFGSALFAWNSKKQEIVTQSFAKAKYMAAAATMNQAL
ncbi:Uncharacterized protein TCM_027059 [Theobroma cacao]|uniref:Integrase catalytic domain-containing protein n=1 Tax=Theobroma cacao TaxID=3641 RepID=A0A061G777_THECC|nr:Uncharacterized protein TCM_027059 [Theobroma cacao]